MPELFICSRLTLHKVKVEQAERIYQFIALFTLADAERNISDHKITGQQCIKVLC